MSENNVIQEPDNGTPVTAEAPKKIRIGFVFLSVVPMAVLMMIQTIAQMPFLILSVVDAMNESQAIPGLDIYTEMMSIFNDKYAIYAYLIYSVIGLIVFPIWYYKGFVKKNPKVKMGDVFTVKSVISCIIIVIALYFFITAFMNLAELLMPQAMAMYAEMIEVSGLVSNTAITVIYAIILGPILEELVFRGVTYGFLEKAGVKPGIAILISSLFFGAMHLILIQVIYAAILGLFLGFIRYKYRSIKITIVTHILFNFMGTYVSSILEQHEPGRAVTFILGGVAMFVLVFAILLINSDKKAFKPVE